MQAVVKTHHIKIYVEGKEIPSKLINLLKKEYGSKLQISSTNISQKESLEVKNTDWFKEIKNQITPGDNLKIYRLNKGLSQGKLAEMLGILPSNISEMERGKRGISKEMAKKLSKLLDIGVEKLI